MLLFLWWLSRPSADLLEPPGAPQPEAGSAPTPLPRVAVPEPVEEDPTADPPEPFDPLAPRPFRGQARTLSNGMTVFLIEDRTEPMVATRIVVRAGSAHEQPGEEGVAHLVEHLMFMGTTTLGTSDWRAEQPWYDVLRDLTAKGAPKADIDAALAEADAYLLNSEYAEALDEIGADDVNAFTSFETTEFVAAVPPNALLPWVVLEAERFADPVFRSFPRVQEVVSLERDGRSVESGVHAVLFEGHPFGRPIGGTAESLAGLDIETAEGFHARHYHPENMAIVIVGEFDSVELWGALEDNFGRWRPGTGASVAVPDMSARRVVYDYDGKESYGRATAHWALPPIPAEDEPALRVALAALASRLAASKDGWGNLAIGLWRYRSGVVMRVEGACSSVKGDAATRCRSALAAALEHLRKTGVTKSDIAWLRKRVWYDRLRELERGSAQAEGIASAWAVGLDLEGGWTLVERLRSVTPTHVNTVIRDNLAGPPFLSLRGVTRSESRRDPHRSRRLRGAPRRGRRKSELFELVTSMERPPLPSRWAERGLHFDSTEDGRVFVSYNPANTLFESRLVYPVGWADLPALRHAASAWERCDGSGCVRSRLRPHGVRLAIEAVEAESTTIVLDGPREGVDAALAIVRAGLSGPVLADHGLGGVADSMMGWALHGPDGPWVATDVDPSAAAMRGALMEMGRYAPRVLYSGTETPEGLWHATEGERFERVPTPRFQHEGLRIGRSETPVITGLARLRLFAPLPPPALEDEALHVVAERLLSGRTGKVRETMREDSALAYYAEARIHRGSLADPGWIELHGYVSEDRVDEGAEAMLSVLEQPAIDAERAAGIWRRAKSEAWRNPVHFRDLPRVLVDAWDRGIDGDPAPVVWEGLSVLEQGDLLAWLEQIAAGPKVLCIRAEKSDRSRWAARGRVEPMPAQ